MNVHSFFFQHIFNYDCEILLIMIGCSLTFNGLRLLCVEGEKLRDIRHARQFVLFVIEVWYLHCFIYYKLQNTVINSIFQIGLSFWERANPKTPFPKAVI